VTYWSKQLLPSGETWGSYTNLGSADIFPDVGILGTPVIDPSTKAVYLVTKSKTTSGGAYRSVSMRSISWMAPNALTALFHSTTPSPRQALVTAAPRSRSIRSARTSDPALRWSTAQSTSLGHRTATWTTIMVGSSVSAHQLLRTATLERHPQ